MIVVFVHPSYRNGGPSLHGQTAKNFDLTIDGRPSRLSDLQGKVVLLNFWASWCQPCVDEAASLDALQKKIAPLGGTILGISVDDDPAAYENFLGTYNVDFPTFRDPSQRIPLSYGTTMYPETFVIDRDGKIDSKIVGPQDWTSPAMMAYLDSVLRLK
ncbi:MAG: TlpA family protein disulfide reductase [Acidobacteriota bacterium]|nr:TlpA family protein disulfide reductase [Acidobacteriota bacterium]